MEHHFIVDFIPADHFISRAELVRITGQNDRSVRRLIERARRAGNRIVSNTHTGGYKIAETGAEWQAFVDSERRRAVATFKRTTGIPLDQLEGIAE